MIKLMGILSTHKSALDSSETGTGKTIVGAEIAARFKADCIPVLVICPKAVIPSWERELKERGISPAHVINYDKLRGGKTQYGHWDKKKWVWDLGDESLIIFDEAHKCAGVDTKNSKMLIEAKDRYHVLMLSATLASSPTQMRAAGYLLGAHGLGNFWQWCMKNGCVKNRWNGIDFGGDPIHIKGIAESIAHRCSRMTVAELGDHFTETQIVTEPLDFGDDVAAIYDEMEAELAALEEASKSDKKNSAAEALVAQLRARQRVELLKVPVIVEMAEDLLAEGKSVAIFTNFKATMEALVPKLWPKAGISCIHGDQTAEERQTAIDLFQSDMSRVALCQTAAGGVGISLHDITGKHPRAAIISPDWNEKNIIQVIGRVHRAGGKTPSMQRILFAAGTVEEKVEKSVRKKIELLNLLNEESTCTDTALQVSHTTTQTYAESLEPIMTPIYKSKTAEAVLQAMVNGTEIPLPKTKNSNVTTHTDSATRPHAQFSPSALKNFEACPSFRGRSGTNPIAEAGTRIHEAVEKEDPSLLQDENEQLLAKWCLDFLYHQRRERAASANLVASHQEIWLQMPLGDNSTSGTSDLLDIYQEPGNPRKSAVMYDWKTGYGSIEDAETNTQVWAYTYGVFQKFPDIDELAFFLVLPRRQEISYATFKRSDLARIKLRLSTIIARAKLAAETNPTEGVCDYCSNQGSCPALASKALVIGQKAGFDVPSSVSLDGTAADRSKLLKLANILQGWCEETKKELLRQALEEGKEIPGFRLDQRRTPRTIAQPLMGYDAVKELVSLEEFLLACTRVSVPTLEKFVSERAPKGKKAEAKQHLEDVLRDKGALGEEGTIHVLKAIKA
jgi:superfamily II DNA or RNA helicase